MVPGEQADAGGEQPHERAWHMLGNEPQTDTRFDTEIAQRMGGEFYAKMFAPAIAAARAQGERYERIRDTIQHGWTPARS